MKWTIRQIRDHVDDIVQFEESLDIKEALMERDASIIDVDTVSINGYFVPSNDEIILHGQIKASLVVPSSRSLEPVSLQLEIPIKERYVYEEYDGNIEDYEETTIILEHDYIDLDTAVADVIVLNIPIQVIKPEEQESELPSGNHWRVVTEEEYEQQQAKEKSETVDSRFAALKTLLNNNDEDE
ncbi:YceD family protein [Aerococcaceae bacterium WGS1372]